MNLAFNSKHPYVPKPARDHNVSRWIASLSDGTTVFEDVTPHIKSSWRRLQDHVQLHNLKVTNLRLEAYGRSIILIPYKDDKDVPQLNGYWHSKQMGALLSTGGVIESKRCGIGFIKGKEIFITWVDQRGNISQEARDYSLDDLGCIVNNAV